MKTIILLILMALSPWVGLACGSYSSEPEKGFVVHEWGTFTSVQGADGIQMEWNPLEVAELPEFVYDLNKPGPDSNRRKYQAFASKTAMFAKLRMETPVIYFYSETNLHVDLKVGFPQGIITEWYPQVAEIGQLIRRTGRSEESPKSYLAWKNFEVLASPGEHQLPNDKTGSHYYAARQTRAALVKVPIAQKTSEVEKFLFYRGVGHFEAPLRTSLVGSDLVRIENRGSEKLVDLFLYELKNGRGQFTYVEALAAGETKLLPLHASSQLIAQSELQEKIAARMQVELQREGLYVDEAKSMTDTWKDSWFGEEGLRVLYTLSREWTDKQLPLSITPKPTSVARVMVGRAEMITPAMESQLLQHLVRYNTTDELTKQQVINEARNLRLGRFAEPAMRRVLKNNRDKELNKLGWNLLEAINKPAGEKKVATLRKTS